MFFGSVDAGLLTFACFQLLSRHSLFPCLSQNGAMLPLILCLSLYNIVLLTMDLTGKMTKYFSFESCFE